MTTKPSKTPRNESDDKWFKATEAWLDAHDALSHSAAQRTECAEIAASLRKRAGECYAAGNDKEAEFLRREANLLSLREEKWDSNRELHLKVEDTIRLEQGPQDL